MTIKGYDICWRRCALALALMLVCALALPARAAHEFKSLDEAYEYLRVCTQRRDERIVLTLPASAVSAYDDDELRLQLVMAAPLLSRLHSTHIRTADSLTCEITPTYRAGVRMSDAWRSGDLSALSESEVRALQIAVELAIELKARYDTNLELEKAIFDELCSRLTYVNSAVFASDHDTPITTATNALLYGEANCQGYSDAFYLLASLCGIDVGFQNGFDSRGNSHLWNTICLDGNWYAVDVTAGDSGDGSTGEPLINYALFNAGIDACAGSLNWPTYYQSVELAPFSDDNYFFNAGPPNFGSSFDDIEALCRYLYDQRAGYGATEVYALLTNCAKLDLEEFNATLAHIVEDVYRHPRATSWRVWSWPQGEDSTCLLLRWNQF